MKALHHEIKRKGDLKDSPCFNHFRLELFVDNPLSRIEHLEEVRGYLNPVSRSGRWGNKLEKYLHLHHLLHDEKMIQDGNRMMMRWSDGLLAFHDHFEVFEFVSRRVDA
ncbi:hypothetical protein Tco_0871515 [Tanacetum coccineum]